MPYEEYDHIDGADGVLAAAKALPDFAMKSQVVACLERRNVNDYNRALELLAEASVQPGPNAAQLEAFANRIRAIEASDRVGE